jgi:hypothetical protein
MVIGRWRRTNDEFEEYVSDSRTDGWTRRCASAGSESAPWYSRTGRIERRVGAAAASDNQKDSEYAASPTIHRTEEAVAVSQLHFVNKYDKRIWVAIAFPNDACSAYGPPWGTKGWWAIDPGRQVYVLADKRIACFYAESSDGLTWAGSQGPVYLPQPAFESCWGIGDTSPETEVVGMRVAYINDNNLYVNLFGPDDGCTLRWKDGWIGPFPHDPPMSFDEWQYMNYNNNCYNYACDIRTDSFAQPGYATGQEWNEFSCGNVGSAAVRDGLVAVDTPECPNGECAHVVALIISPENQDYHWLRRDSDTTWSHKRGHTWGSQVDDAGAQIYDPATASFEGYFFCGYYCVNKATVKIGGSWSGVVRMKPKQDRSLVQLRVYSGRPDPTPRTHGVGASTDRDLRDAWPWASRIEAWLHGLRGLPRRRSSSRSP